MTRVEFSDNRPPEKNCAKGYGGGANLEYLEAAAIADAELADNESFYGGGLRVRDTDAVSIRNLSAHGNRAAYGGGLCATDSDTVSMNNASFVNNDATEAGAAIVLDESTLALNNAIIALNTGSPSIHSEHRTDATNSTVTWTAFWDNEGGPANEDWDDVLAGPDVTAVDPGIARDPTAADATLVLARDSMLIDAGDPTLLDRDGSRSDPGAWGGPDVWTEDADRDGYETDVDCDDTDPDVHPDAEETWYDGADQDCLLTSDYDADGDGADAYHHGGTDCDDSDPTATGCDDSGSDGPSALPGTGGDGPAATPGGAPDTGCGGGCAQGSVAAGLFPVLWGLLATRRRRCSAPTAR